MSEQIVTSKCTTEFVITDKNRENKHLIAEAYIRQWVRELNGRNLRVVSVIPTIFPDEDAGNLHNSTFAATFICENVSTQKWRENQ